MTATVQSLKETINNQNGRFGCFTDNFYQFIREQIGIGHLYDLRNSTKTFEERLAKVELMLQRAEYDDDKLQANEAALGNFSDEAIELAGIVKKIGKQKEVCNKEYLTKFFETFYMKRQGIETLDSNIEQFTNLKVLNLSFNKLETVQYLPPNLEELHLAANSISSFKPSLRLESLVHLGLSYNQISDCELSNLVNSFPNLFSVDLSFNRVCSLQVVVDSFSSLTSLKMINLKANPVVLTKDYRAIMK